MDAAAKHPSARWTGGQILHSLVDRNLYVGEQIMTVTLTLVELNGSLTTANRALLEHLNRSYCIGDGLMTLQDIQERKLAAMSYRTKNSNPDNKTEAELTADYNVEVEAAIARYHQTFRRPRMSPILPADAGAGAVALSTEQFDEDTIVLGIPGAQSHISVSSSESSSRSSVSSGNTEDAEGMTDDEMDDAAPGAAPLSDFEREMLADDEVVMTSMEPNYGDDVEMLDVSEPFSRAQSADRDIMQSDDDLFRGCTGNTIAVRTGPNRRNVVRIRNDEVLLSGNVVNAEEYISDPVYGAEGPARGSESIVGVGPGRERHAGTGRELTPEW